jgi:hypothetical protein
VPINYSIHKARITKSTAIRPPPKLPVSTPKEIP